MITIVNTYTEYACLKKDESTTTCKTARKHEKIKLDLIANVCKIFLQYGDKMRKYDMDKKPWWKFYFFSFTNN